MTNYLIQVKEIIQDYLDKKINIETFIKERFYKIWYNDQAELSIVEFKIFEEIFFLWDCYEPDPRLRKGTDDLIDEKKFRRRISLILDGIEYYIKNNNKYFDEVDFLNKLHYKIWAK